LQQFAFEISQWRSSVAPATNQVVEMDLADGKISGVSQVSDEILLKEKASAFAGKLGTAGTAALQSLKDSAPTDAGPAANLVARLGKPLLVAQGLFALGALFLPYMKINNPLLSQGFS